MTSLLKTGVAGLPTRRCIFSVRPLPFTHRTTYSTRTKRTSFIWMLMTHTHFRNGTVWTGTGTTGALSVREGRIEAVGAEADATEADEIIDLEGGLLLPAFGDGHCHPDLAGFEALG